MKQIITASIILETDRLKLSIIQEADTDAVFQTMNSKRTADIISFLTWPMTKTQTANWCNRSVNGINTQKEFLFIARNRLDNSPIGCIGLLLSEDRNVAEIGYWVSENKQGCGFATEMLRAMINLAFDTFSLSKLVATTAFENNISLRVLEKQGFQIIGRKDLPTAKDSILSCHLLTLSNQAV